MLFANRCMPLFLILILGAGSPARSILSVRLNTSMIPAWLLCWWKRLLIAANLSLPIVDWTAQQLTAACWVRILSSVIATLVCVLKMNFGLRRILSMWGHRTCPTIGSSCAGWIRTFTSFGLTGWGSVFTNCSTMLFYRCLAMLATLDRATKCWMKIIRTPTVLVLCKHSSKIRWRAIIIGGITIAAVIVAVVGGMSAVNVSA